LSRLYPDMYFGSGGGKCYEPCGADEYINGMSSMGNAPVCQSKIQAGARGVTGSTTIWTGAYFACRECAVRAVAKYAAMLAAATPD